MGKISHKGVVEAVDGASVKVRITQSSACGTCKAASHCSVSESKEKMVEVVNLDEGKTYAAGDEVMVSMPVNNGSKAVFLAFILPFLVMMAVLLVALWTTGNEALSALLAVASLLPYYVIIHLLEKKLSKVFSFVIENTKNIN